MDKIDFTKPLQVRYADVWYDVSDDRVHELIRNKPEPRFVWMNIYNNTYGYTYSREAHARKDISSFIDDDSYYLHTLKINLYTGETEKVYL